MEVRPGSKQTKAGAIPEDWKTDTMLRISRQIMDYRGRTPKKLGMEWGGGDIPALSAGNVKKGFVDFSEECYYGSDELYKRWMTKGDVAKDDILFTTEAPLGNVALVPDDRRYILSQRTILLQVDPQRASSTFLFQMMLSAGFQRMLADHSSGSTAKGIQRKKFEQLTVALPPPLEQRAIATALSDVDALLGGLDQLIAKKRDLKRAAMQQLLTGQTRLPGFRSEWEVKRIGDLIKAIGDGGTPSTANPHNFGGGIGWVVIDDITDEITATATTLTDRGLQSCAATLWPPGTLIISTGATIGEVGIARIPVATKQGICGVCVDPAEASMHFLKYWFVLNKPLLLSIAQGSTIKEVRAATLVQFELRVPLVPEQTAIASVLSDMDAEFAALKARRDKTHDLKQAMMQELLTGKTRLVPAGSAHA